MIASHQHRVEHCKISKKASVDIFHSLRIQWLFRGILLIQ